MALTATATMRVREDIVKLLGLGKHLAGDYHCCVNTFHRSNLYFAVHHTKMAGLANLERDLAKYIAFPSELRAQPSAASFFRGSAVASSRTLGLRPVQAGPAMRAAAAAEARSTIRPGVRPSHELGASAQSRTNMFKAAAGLSRVQAAEVTDYPRTKTLTCPMCNQEITYPEGASPDAVIGAHLDSSCGTIAGKPARDAGYSDVGLRGGGSSRNNEAEQSSCSLAAKESTDHDVDDDIALAHLAGMKRARPPEVAPGLRGCSLPTPTSAEAITISDSDDSSDSDEIEIVDADASANCRQDAQDARDGASAPCVGAAAGSCGAELMPVEEELAALEMLDEEIARQRATLTDVSASEPLWDGVEVDENGVLIEDEPEDLGEYSRPAPQPVLKERSSTGCKDPLHAPFATGSTIVYAPTRVDVENIAAKLKVH